MQRKNYTDSCSSKCLRSCDQTRFGVKHEPKGRNVRPDLTFIELNWGSFEFITLEQAWVYSITSFIAALGGAVSLWMGLSFLSLIQGGTYMYQYVKENVVKKKSHNAQSIDGLDHGHLKEPPLPPASKNPLESPFKRK